MHLSKEEQRQRLLRRLTLRQKHWKFSPDDLKERELWNDYRSYYQEALRRTSKPHAPWFVIPADNKPASRLIVGSILEELLTQYKDICEPELSASVIQNLDQYRSQLEAESDA